MAQPGASPPSQDGSGLPGPFVLAWRSPRHFMPYLDNHVALLSGVNISCGFGHPVAQVSPLIPGDSELKGTVWDEDAEAVPCEILKELWGNSPSPQCIFQPTKGSISLARPGDEAHAILADGGDEI